MLHPATYASIRGAVCECTKMAGDAKPYGPSSGVEGAWSPAESFDELSRASSSLIERYQANGRASGMTHISVPLAELFRRLAEGPS